MKKLKNKNKNIKEIEKFVSVCSCNCAGCLGCNGIFTDTSRIDAMTGANVSGRNASIN